MITSNKTLSVFHPTYHLHPHKKLYVLTIFQVLIGSNVCHHLVLRDKVVILPILLVAPGAPSRINIIISIIILIIIITILSIDDHADDCDDDHQSRHHLVVCGMG